MLIHNIAYHQQAETVSTKQWRSWLDEQGYREDMSPDFNMDDPLKTDFPALIKDKTERWIAARQAVANYLDISETCGQSYDNLTADICACIIGTLKPPVEMLELYK